MFLVIYHGLKPQSWSLVADILPVLKVGRESPDDISAVKSERSATPAAASDTIEAPVFGAVGEAYGKLLVLAYGFMDLSMPPYILVAPH